MSKACSNCGSIFDDDYSFVGVMGNLYCKPCHSSHIRGSLNQQIQIYNDWWRMHYAGLAMQGILTQEKSVDENGNDIFITYEWVAITAFKIADAMLKQNKEPL